MQTMIILSIFSVQHYDFASEYDNIIIIPRISLSKEKPIKEDV
jgi:hypothetical protein